MSGPFGSSQWMYASGGFYNGVATQSLRFDDGSSAYLSRTPSSAGNRKTWTWSGWVKRSNLGATHTLFDSRPTGEFAFGFLSGDTFYVASSSNFRITNQVFRDVSSWYHFVVVLDTTQATGSNRIKVYVNGNQITSFGTSADPSQNAEFGVNFTQLHSLGRYTSGGYFDGYMAEVNLIDGQALDPTYFGEFKNGVWIPIEYTGSYGTNGFRLQFNQTGTGSASSSTIGADTSGNDNHFSSSGIVASDCDMPDSPENNFCTFNSVGRRYGQSYVGTFSEGNLKVASGGNATNVFGSMAINQIASQGGVYFEIRMDSLDTSRTYFGVVGDTGVNNQNASSNSGGYTFPIKGMINNDPRGDFATVTDASVRVDLTANTAFSNGDVAGIAILSDGKFFCHRNGTYLQNASGNVGNPSTGANPIATIDLTLGDWVAYVGYNSSFSINFGQDGSFSGNETSGGYQDGNGIGDFMFAVPTNCFAICTSNMAEPTISPNEDTQADDYFNTVIYSGNDDATRTFDVGFVSDFAWFKARNQTGYGHNLYDSVRGVQKYLQSNTTSAEITNTEGVTDFDDNGLLKIGTDAFLNESGTTMVLWNWKAGGTAVSNTDGSITSSVSANTDAGFSIVTYSGNGVSGATLGHGLSQAPNFAICKRRNSTSNWRVGTDATGTLLDGYFNLTLSMAADSTTYQAFNSSTITLGNSADVNTTGGIGGSYVMYVFHDVKGYSKFGSYTGNGSADGTFVYTGFRPAFVLVKRTNSAQDWTLFDSSRNPTNATNLYLHPNNSAADGSGIGDGIDLVSNGFKMRHQANVTNNSGSPYIYMAFAENPFKYANAR